MFGILTISYLLNNLSFGHLTRIFATLGLSFYAGVATMVIYDFYSPTFFIFELSNGMLFISLNNFTVIFIILGLMSLTVSFMLAMSSLKELPEEIFSFEMKSEILTVLIVAFVSIIFLIFLTLDSVVQISFNLILTLSMNGLFFYLLYYLYKQPFLQFNMGLSSKLLVEEAYIGYVLGALTDIGPDVIKTSTEFNNRVGLDEIDIHTLNLSGTTALGINETFTEKIAIMPVPKTEDYSVIMYTFRIHFDGLEDNRIKMTTSAVLGIIIPSALLVNLKNLKKVVPKINNIMENYSTIDQLIEETNIDKVIMDIMKNLIY